MSSYDIFLSEESHIPIVRLWDHSRELYPNVLTTSEWHHLMRCEHCVSLLQTCYKSDSVNDITEGLKQLGINADLAACDPVLKTANSRIK